MITHALRRISPANHRQPYWSDVEQLALHFMIFISSDTRVVFCSFYVKINFISFGPQWSTFEWVIGHRLCHIKDKFQSSFLSLGRTMSSDRHLCWNRNVWIAMRENKTSLVICNAIFRLRGTIQYFYPWNVFFWQRSSLIPITNFRLVWPLKIHLNKWLIIVFVEWNWRILRFEKWLNHFGNSATYRGFESASEVFS